MVSGLPVVLAFAGCEGKDDGATDTDAATTEGSATTDGSATTEGSGTAVPPATEFVDTEDPTTGDVELTEAMMTTGATTAGSESTGEPPSPAACGGGTCSEGQICIQPGDRCDMQQDPPVFVPQDPKCAEVPPACADEEEAGVLLDCLAAQLCPGYSDEFSGPVSFEDGLLTCNDEAPDCF